MIEDLSEFILYLKPFTPLLKHSRNALYYFAVAVVVQLWGPHWPGEP